MDRGIYTATSGGLLNARRLEAIANNLANVSTVGFKAERLVSRQQDFGDTLAATIPGIPARSEGDFDRTPGVVHVASMTDFSVGPIAQTGNPLNVALAKDNQFFVVATPDGDQYTRAGNFTLTSDGVLVTPDGQPVTGDGGPLSLPPGQTQISASGAVSVNGQVIGRLRVVQFSDLTQLERVEGVRFRAAQGAEPENVPADLVPQAVEMPNVSAIDAMVDMISAQRAFEAYQKTVRTVDEMNERVVRNIRIAP